MSVSPVRRALPIVLAVIACGCGTVAEHHPTPAAPQPVVLLPWLSASDYTTIKIAVAVRDRVLLHETDWRRKSFGASLAAQTLLIATMLLWWKSRPHGNHRNIISVTFVSIGGW